MAAWVTDVVEFDSEIGVVAAGVTAGTSVVVVDSVVGAAVVAAGVSVVEVAALDAVDAVEVEDEEHLDEKPLTRSYTFSTRPLVGTVRSQSGGFRADTDEIRDWQLSDAHISTYWASSGSDVEYSRLKPESSEQPWNELSVSTLASVEYAVVCCDDEHVSAAAEPMKAAAATARTVFVFMVPGWRVLKRKAGCVSGTEQVVE